MVEDNCLNPESSTGLQPPWPMGAPLQPAWHSFLPDWHTLAPAFLTTWAWPCLAPLPSAEGLVPKPLCCRLTAPLGAPAAPAAPGHEVPSVQSCLWHCHSGWPRLCSVSSHRITEWDKWQAGGIVFICTENTCKQHNWRDFLPKTALCYVKSWILKQ